MNFWGFTPAIFDELETYFEAFLRSDDAKTNIKAECLLPNMVGDLLAQGRLHVSVLHSADRWFGMTYHEGPRDRRRRAPPPARNRRLPRQAVTPQCLTEFAPRTARIR